MKPITDILREYRNGRAVDVASLDLNELIRAVDATGKPGELTITIKVKPEKGGGSQKVLAIGIKSKIPKVDIPEAVFFSDGDGDLHRQDPAQAEMTFRDTRTAGNG
jgi:hypothetical protein